MTSTGRIGSTRVRAVVIGTVGAVVLAGALVAFGEPGPAVAVVDDWGPGDGLTRYTVTLAAGSVATTGAGTTVDGGAAEPAGGPTVGGGTADRGTSLSRGTIDIGLLAAAQGELGAGGEVVVVGGSPYYVVGDAVRMVGSAPGGEVVPAAGPDAPAPVPTQAADGGGDRQTALAALAARPGIVSAQPIDASTALVATRLSADELAAFPEVADVVASPQVDVLADAPDDPYLAQYGWNLHNTGSNAYQQAAVAGADVDAPTAWPATQGQGAVVAIVDTGFDSDHPDLVGSLWTNPTEACGAADTNGNGKAGDCHGWNFYANSADVDNGSLGSHGTSVAGVIGARLDNGQGSAGVAPAVSLMPLVVGGGSQVDVNLAALAIRYAADNGADVVNASFGGSFAGPALTALSSAIDYAVSKGVVVVAAAGNDSADRDAAPMYPASLPNPALITVASSTATDELAAHSAYGATSVDIAAPGTLIFTTYNDGGYRLVSGTSVAAPHVTAAAALQMSVADLTPAQVRQALLDDAERLPAFAGRMVSGGRLDVGPLGAFGRGTAYTFSGMVAAPGEQSPSIEVTSDAAGGSYDVVLGLAMLVDGEIWAVSGEDVTLGQTTATTGDDGTVRFPLGSLAAFGTQTVAPHLTLGEGSFGLTVQVLHDGEPLTRPYAAPLLVRTAADPGAGGGTDPGAGGGTDPGAGGGTDPGSSGGSDPGAGGGTDPGSPGGSDPGTGGGTDPGSSGGSDPGAGGGTDPGSSGGSDPGAGGGTDPGSSGGSGPSTGGGTQPGSGSGGDPGAGGVDPGTGGGTDPGTGGGSDPGVGGGSDPGTPTPDDGFDVKRYDHVGAFAVTEISPVHVAADGGTLVVVRGDALEPGLGVRVGTSAAGHVVVSTGSLLAFVTPPRLPGTYDVTIYALGRSSVLADALVYGAAGSGGSDPGSPGGSDPGTGGGTDPGSGGGADPGPGGGSDPGSPGGSDPGTGGGSDPGSSGGDTPTAPQATRVGPNGEHLVRNDALAPLARLWTLQCTTRCAGIQM